MLHWQLHPKLIHDVVVAAPFKHVTVPPPSKLASDVVVAIPFNVAVPAPSKAVRKASSTIIVNDNDLETHGLSTRSPQICTGKTRLV
jgi:hypothetical protein